MQVIRLGGIALIFAASMSCESMPTSIPAGSYRPGLGSGVSGLPFQPEITGRGPFSITLTNATTKEFPLGPIHVTSFYMLGPDSRLEVPVLDLREGQFVALGELQPGYRWSIRWTSSEHPNGALRYASELAGPGGVNIVWTNEGFQGKRGVPFVSCGGAATCSD